MNKLETLNKEKLNLKRKLLALEAETSKLTSRVAVICEDNAAYGKGCGAGLYIDELEYIQTHWYEHPYGCTGGDNWHQGEGQFICPKCAHRNRLLNRQDIELLKYKFKLIKDEYKERK